MPDPIHGVADEVEKLEHEAEEGKTARTPLLLVGGVGVVVGVVVLIVLALAFTAYYLAK